MKQLNGIPENCWWTCIGGGHSTANKVLGMLMIAQKRDQPQNSIKKSPEFTTINRVLVKR